VKDGGRICGRTHVASIEGGSPCTVKTDSKKKITADAVVVCTNSSISDYVRTHTEQAPYRTFAIAAVIPRGSVTKALYWDTSDPYHYVRLQPLDDPSQGVLETGMLYDALIVGGEQQQESHATGIDIPVGHGPACLVPVGPTLVGFGIAVEVHLLRGENGDDEGSLGDAGTHFRRPSARRRGVGSPEPLQVLGRVGDAQGAPLAVTGGRTAQGGGDDPLSGIKRNGFVGELPCHPSPPKNFPELQCADHLLVQVAVTTSLGRLALSAPARKVESRTSGGHAAPG